MSNITKFSIEIFQPRIIEFKEIVFINEWAVKVYTITHKESFGAEAVIENAINNLKTWITKTNSEGFEPYEYGFLIVHEGKDAVWTLFNWWVSGGILKSITFSTEKSQPDQFVLRSNENFMACVWELSVIHFERQKWVEQVLEKADKPMFTNYLNEKLNGCF